MPIEISTQIIHNSYAAVINKIDPNANIYDNPNQQGTAYPAWFIVHRAPVEVQRDVGKRYGGNRYTLTYQIDIWYMIQQNIPRLYDQYTAIAEQLDEQLEYLPIFGSDAVVHVYDKSWSLELNSMKYSTTLRLRVCRSNPDYFNESTIDVITTDVFLKMQNEAILSFQNTSHPEFDAQLPNPISVTKGRSINLPFVGGEFEDDNYKWTPSGWTLGNFGALIQLNESMTADLLWRSEEKTASLSFTNTLHPEFDVDLPDTIIANKGSSVELPAVSGTFPVGSFDWNPSSWDIGSFGGSFILNEDTTADLQWESEEVFFDISFTNTSHPEFDVTLPQSEHVSRGSSVTLPTVEGEFIQGNYKWNPDAWDIGAFGDSYTPSDNVSANLLWRSRPFIYEITAYFSPAGASGTGNIKIGGDFGWDSASLYDASGNPLAFDLTKKYTVLGMYNYSGASVATSSGSRIKDTNGFVQYIPSGSKRVFTIVLSLSEQTTIDAYLTSAGASATGNTFCSNNLTYTMYDSNGVQIPYDSTKTYTTVATFVVNGNTASTDFTGGYADWSDTLLKGRPNGNKDVYKIVIRVE